MTGTTYRSSPSVFRPLVPRTRREGTRLADIRTRHPRTPSPDFDPSRGTKMSILC